MWPEKFIILFSFCFGINLGQEFNSTLLLKNGNSSYFNYNGTINRIVGGKPLNINQVPFQIGLFRNGYFICGGSLLSRDWVLTAAHCIDGGGDFGIRAGSRFVGYSGQVRHSRFVVLNTGFNPKTLNHDLALIRVDIPFKLTRNVRPVLLARPKWKLPRRYLVTGWGSQKEGVNRPSYGLRGAVVQKVYRNTCQAHYKGKSVITQNMICAAAPGQDACQGDSGGPLTLNGIQYGIVSFGIGCARRAYPGVYTNLRREYPWIIYVIKRFGGRMPR